MEKAYSVLKNNLKFYIKFKDIIKQKKKQFYLYACDATKDTNVVIDKYYETRNIVNQIYERAKIISDWLKTLKPDDVEILKLLFLKGLKTSEVAERLDIFPRRLFRKLQKLNTKIDQYINNAISLGLEN